MTTLRMTRPADLREGDQVDLEGDPYADAVHWQYEYAVVEHVEQEAPDCVRVDFEGYSYGFPTNHNLKVVQD